jgi:hypothetical protein
MTLEKRLGPGDLLDTGTELGCGGVSSDLVETPSLHPF